MSALIILAGILFWGCRIAKKTIAEAALSIIFLSVPFFSIVHNLWALTTKNQLQKDQLETINRQNRALLSVVSHDIANQILLIESQSSRLSKNKGLGDPQGRALKMLKASQSIKETLNVVQNLQAVESGKLILANDCVLLKPLIVESIYRQEAEIRHKELHIKIEIPNNLWLETDLGIFKNQILANLISNAIKFTPQKGQIEVLLTTELDGYHLFIRNTGSGIPTSSLPHLFSWEHPTHQKGTLGETGTGLGLPICKRFSELLGLEIHAKNEQHDTQTEEVACFYLRLPNDKVHSQNILPEPKAS